MYDYSIDYFGPHKRPEKTKKMKTEKPMYQQIIDANYDIIFKRNKMEKQSKKLFDNFCLAVIVIGLVYLFAHIVFWKF